MVAKLSQYCGRGICRRCRDQSWVGDDGRLSKLSYGGANGFKTSDSGRIMDYQFAIWSSEECRSSVV